MQARILVIINEPVLAGKIFANLKSFGYELLPLAIRSEDAIRSIERDDPDLIILDLEFSGDLDGVTLAEIIHNRFDRPMIFVTESTKNLSLKRVQLTNPYGFVLKDFDPYRFSVVITIALQKYITEKQLRDSEDRLRMIADFTYDWEYWTDEAGHFVYMSPSVERVTGYTVAEFTKNPGLLQEIVHPLDKQKSHDHSIQRKSKKGVSDFKLRIIKKDSSVRWIQHICQPIVSEGSNVFGHYATNHDITDQQNAEFTLVESEKRYRSLFEDARVSMWEEDVSEVKKTIDDLRQQGILDLREYFETHPDKIIECMSKVKVLDINKAGLVMYKAPDKETLIRNSADVFRVADPILMINEIMTLAEGADTFDGEGTNFDLEGNPIDVQIHWSILPDSTEKYSRILISLIDVTNRKARERSLEVVSTVSAAVRIARTRSEMLEVISSQLTRLFGADGWAALLMNGDGIHCKAEHATGIWEGLSGTVIEISDPAYKDFFSDDQPVIVKRNERIPANIGLADDYPHLHRVVCPLIAEEQVLGGMVMGRQTPFEPADRDLLHSLSNILAVALYRTSLLDKTRSYADHMAVISTLGRRLSQSLNLAEIYECLGQGILQVFPDVTSIFITTYDSDKKINNCVFGIHNNEEIDVSQFHAAPLELPGMGSQSEVIYTRQPLILNHIDEQILQKIRKFTNGFDGSQISSGVFVPLIVKDEILGVLQLQSTQPNYFTQSDVDILMPLASTGAIAIKNGRLFAETEERLQRLSMLHTIDTAISSSLELKVTLNILVNELTSMPGFKAADVLLYDPARQVLEQAAGRGCRSDVSAIRIGEGLAGKAALEGKTIACTVEDANCYYKILGPLYPPEEFAGYIALPMINKGQIRGVMEVYCREARFISVEWLEFLETLAGQAAIAIDNNLLVNQLQRSNLELMLAYDSTLEGWSKALDLRDRETEGHSQRVTELSVKLAEAMGLRGHDLVHIRRGSLLHDIGKMGIPDSILLKEGPLNPDEWVIMRKHPDYAFEMLSPINYLSKSLDIPYCHHEHWDGKGYPRGLKEEQIPLAARIFAIADVYDSLVSDRPYRKAWTKEKALEQIKIESGTHLDARIVDVFLKIMEE